MAAAENEVTYPGPRGEGHEDELSRIRVWWMEQAAIDLESVLKKLKLYGSLSFHGHAYKRLMYDRMPPNVEGDEIAIAMYVAGKVARLIEGYSHGETPTDDTWDDIACYASMARWVRDHGRWP